MDSRFDGWYYTQNFRYSVVTECMCLSVLDWQVRPQQRSAHKPRVLFSFPFLALAHLFYFTQSRIDYAPGYGPDLVQDTFQPPEKVIRAVMDDFSEYNVQRTGQKTMSAVEQ